MFSALHAERASRLRGRRPSRLPAGAVEPEPVPITRVTVIAAESFGDEESAQEWLERCRGRGEQSDEDVSWALDHVNTAVAAYRVAAADPHAREISREQALRVRLGYGGGSDLVNGAWNDALVMPAAHARSRVRRRMLSPEEELAGILTGRRPRGYPSEELLLRARLDLDCERHAEAALQTRATVDALRAELERDKEDAGALSAYAEALGQLSQAALSGALGEEQRAELERIVTELERTLRRRRYAAS